MMTTSDLKPICSFSNVSTPTWESVNFGEILWNFGAMGAFGDHLQHFQLQDEILHARRANSKQAIWKALLLGYAVVIIAAHFTAPSLRRRHVIPAALLLVIMIPLTNPYLQSLSSLTLFMAIVVAILEVTCVVRLLSLKPFGPVAAAIGALLRLMTALAPLFFKHSVLVNSGSQLTSLGLLAPAAFLLLFVYVMDTSEFSEGKNCSNATVDDVYMSFHGDLHSKFHSRSRRKANSRSTFWRAAQEPLLKCDEDAAARREIFATVNAPSTHR
ncbi:hypothetical protein HPB51_011526 [Rhipicephalus microplus]|uniref:Transmembrane protein n=1 Tax=Rhipicephalus microplus TaxID=6941 RepID=A0A9J6E8R7_RHIMP|nr:hypothetical protein HPB51_011526 [Rhipicephalus microplus]